jgi:hypothetical protein
MTTPSEQWIVSALREATDRMPLPPESRWIRERRSTPSVSMILLVGVAAILIVAIGMTIGAIRAAPRVVPAASPDAFVVAEDREWRITRFATPSDLALLRPAWIPGGYRGSAECPSPQAIISIGGIPSRPSAPSGYSVEYRRQQPDGRCASLQLFGQLGTQDYIQPGHPDDWIETSTFDARGTTVHVSSGVMGPDLDASLPFQKTYLIHLWWNESGAHYDVISISNADSIDLADLVRVIEGLEPMRR